MSPECDFFSGSNGVRCHRVRALSVIKEHLGLNVEELKELLPVLCQEEGDSERFIPHVLELSFGVDRHVYALLDLNYVDDKERGNVVLKLPYKVSPYKVGVFPLMNKDKIPEVAKEIFENTICAYDFFTYNIK